MFIIFKAYGGIFKMNTTTGETWRLSSGQEWSYVKGSTAP